MSVRDLPRPESIRMSRETTGTMMAIGLKKPNKKKKKTVAQKPKVGGALFARAEQ